MADSPLHGLPTAFPLICQPDVCRQHQGCLRLITDQTKGDVLNLEDPVNLPNTSDKTVKEVLLEKHPLSRPAMKEALIQSEAPPHPHPIIFDALDASKVRTAALRTQGAAGPSGL